MHYIGNRAFQRQPQRCVIRRCSDRTCINLSLITTAFLYSLSLSLSLSLFLSLPSLSFYSSDGCNFNQPSSGGDSVLSCIRCGGRGYSDTQTALFQLPSGVCHCAHVIHLFSPTLDCTASVIPQRMSAHCVCVSHSNLG